MTCTLSAPAVDAHSHPRIPEHIAAHPLIGRRLRLMVVGARDQWEGGAVFGRVRKFKDIAHSAARLTQPI